MGYKTAVVKASRKSPSVKITIPHELARELGIKPGDILEWEMFDEKGRPMLKAKKLM